ncbi:hypothetical protein MTO96_028035 [Rhipicephalus appendiculatus]
MANASRAQPAGQRARPLNIEAAIAVLLGMRCTRLRSGVCQLLRHVGLCNEVLRHAGFQIGSFSPSEPGDLSVVRVPGACRDAPADSGSCGCDGKPAMELLNGLLRTHRCIVSVEV